MSLEVQIIAALALDALFGDPRWMVHPVTLIARLAKRLEHAFRKLIASERAAGACTVVFVALGVGLIGWGMISLASLLYPLAGDAVAVYLLYTCFAARDLIVHSRNVAAALRENDLEAARAKVAMIVGRDAGKLEKEGIVRACVESVAENSVDGVTAPLFWAVVGGPVGALAYKAVNTMDSLFGYKNEQYLHFGWLPARLDDAVNWFPARITGVLLAVAAFVLRLRPRAAWKVFRRDRLNHSSPNSGHAEATVAGALGIRLGGVSWYFGRPVEKPFIGDDVHAPDVEHIRQAQALLAVVTILAATVFLAARITVVRYCGLG